MEDSSSIKSNESLTTSDEYEFVNSIGPKINNTIINNPQLQSGTSASELEQTLTEVLLEAQTPLSDGAPRKSGLSGPAPHAGAQGRPRTMEGDTALGVSTPTANADDCRLVGGSKFYQDMDVEGKDGESPTEKQDHMKPESDEEVSDVDQECTAFSGVSYLGAATINAPKSEPEVQRTMAVFCEQRESQTGIAVAVSVPTCSQGLVVLYDAATNSVMARYAVQRILFYARGAAGTAQAACFAFTWSHGDTKESAVFQCHVFKCHIAEAVTQVSSCFAKAFERVPRSMVSSMTSSCTMSGSVLSAPEPPATRTLMHVLECSVEVREADTKGTFSPVPKERVGFKLRAGVDKQVVITVQQVSPNAPLGFEQQGMSVSQTPLPGGGLIIDRCFGVLIAPGRNVKHSDMQLLEMVGGGNTGGGTLGSPCSTSALWTSAEPALSALNMGSSDPGPTWLTVAVDLVLRGTLEPLRLAVETPVRVFPAQHRFFPWQHFSRGPLLQQFFINLKESTDMYGTTYEVLSMETSGELDRSRLNLSLSSLLPSPLTSQPAPPSPDDDISDGDEPLLSGTGEVSKDCCEGVLENWAQVLRSWNGDRPKALGPLVRLGVPEALRGEVWQRLADADRFQYLMDTYRTLITKDCPCEGVIQRDIARTYPAHDHFREAGGLGQDSLLRLVRAYAVHDTEVEYCQGLSFVAATLLLHMPEEQAFCVLVRLMYGYGLRELYKYGFVVLKLRLYQLHRLMEEQMADLSAHFAAMGVDPHMFASQWFLTLFTARFPLPLVFHIVDVFLLQGTDTLFQVALALLARSKKDLMQLDFEGILKYFRVTLPKKCRAEEVSRQIIKQACSIKVKRLSKYQQEFENLTKEVTEGEQMVNELESLRNQNEQLTQDKVTMHNTISELRDTLRRESERSLGEVSRSAAILQEYKDICSRLDQQLTATKEVIRGCITCNAKLNSTDNRKVECVSESDIGPQQRVRELELELAQVKLAHVEAQCTNQELMHQLNTAVSEYQSAVASQKQSWSPWLSRTLGSIKEAAQNSRPTFQTYLSSNFTSVDQPFPPIAPIRRQDSFPLTSQLHHQITSEQAGLRRGSEPPNSPGVLRPKDKRHSMLADYSNPDKKNCDAERNRSRRSMGQEINILGGNPSFG